MRLEAKATSCVCFSECGVCYPTYRGPALFFAYISHTSTQHVDKYYDTHDDVSSLRNQAIPTSSFRAVQMGAECQAGVQRSSKTRSQAVCPTPARHGFATQKA